MVPYALKRPWEYRRIAVLIMPVPPVISTRIVFLSPFLKSEDSTDWLGRRIELLVIVCLMPGLGAHNRRLCEHAQYQPIDFCCSTYRRKHRSGHRQRHQYNIVSGRQYRADYTRCVRRTVFFDDPTNSDAQTRQPVSICVGAGKGFAPHFARSVDIHRASWHRVRDDRLWFAIVFSS